MGHHWRKIAVFAGLLLAVAALASPFLGAIPAKGSPQAKAGTLDLRHWRLQEDGPVRLNGGWSLYLNHLLNGAEEAEALGAAPIEAKVPGEWGRYGKPGRGFATYTLTVMTQGDTGRLAIRIPAIAPAYRLLVDGRVVAETGVVASDPAAVKSAYMPQTVSFEPNGSSFDIVLQVANELYPQGGIWFSLTLGEERSMLAVKERTQVAELAVFGGCALLGLYQLALFALRRTDRSNLYFGICCLLGALRIWVVGGIYIVQLYPHADIRLIITLEYLTYYGGVTCALLFIRQLYPQEFRPAAIKLLAGIGCGFIGAVLLLPVEWFTRTMALYQLVSLVSLGYILTGCILAAWRNREGALLQLAGWLLFGMAALHDILYSNGQMMGVDLQLGHYGFVVLAFIEALELARRFAKAYRVIGRMSEQLLASNRMKDEFLANTSHELKTPLHGIMNLSQHLYEEKAGRLNDEQRGQLEAVISVARRMSNLINDILDLSRLKHSGIQLERGPVDIRAVLSAQYDVFRHYIGDKPVTLRFDWPESLPYADADESRLVQIAYNLIGNAIKFTPEGEVTVSAWAEGGMLHVAVADTGIGIAEEKLETIFHSFEQIGTSVAKEYGGAGLGLGIAKRLAELHGGSVSVVSKAGEGSVFTFTLPVSHAGAAPHRPRSGEPSQLAPVRREAAAATEGPAIVKPDSGKRREPLILAVDDDPVNLRVIQSVLADEPYEIVTAARGQEALDIVDRMGGAIGLVILDVMMPGQSGYETCRQLRRTHPLSELPVLLTTVRSSPTDVMVGFEAGANDYLTKPFEAYELRARTRTLLEMKRSAEDAVRSELAFLQAQIKPHFLYNALNTIITLSLEDPQKTHDLLLNLSRYLRGSFDFKNKQRLVPLRKELELADAYLQIERARFGDRLRVRFETEQGADCLLPPLTLQPLVENAVRHGILKKEAGGTVVVTVVSKDGHTELVVEDDGVGMDIPAETVLAGEDEGKGGVGLRNIDQRMRKLFGTGLALEASASGGTKVTVRIPHHIRGSGEEPT